jgi:D-glycero-alpha-D-manno-heptose 1-phosphate guanylyltransferase
MITEAIVLAGGLGTRLKSVVADLPKSLAPIAGRPFLAYLLDYAKREGIEKFIFALGYKSEQLEDFVKKYLPETSFVFSVEQEPLGTGGAIHKACKLVSTNNAIVLNADTFFGVSFSQLFSKHEQYGTECTLALKPMKKFDRYGIVEIDKKNVVTGFKEKSFQQEGLINGGVYALKTRTFLLKSFPAVFSFEKDYLEKYCTKENIHGFVSDAYFIDIGIPEDYQRAQKELPEEIIDY